LLLQVSKIEKHDCFLLLHVSKIKKHVCFLLLHVSKIEKHVCFLLLHVSKIEKHVCFLLLHVSKTEKHVCFLLLQVSKTEKHVCFLLLQGSKRLLSVPLPSPFYSSSLKDSSGKQPPKILFYPLLLYMKRLSCSLKTVIKKPNLTAVSQNRRSLYKKNSHLERRDPVLKTIQKTQ
jgi:hypothetical protein